MEAECLLTLSRSWRRVAWRLCSPPALPLRRSARTAQSCHGATAAVLATCHGAVCRCVLPALVKSQDAWEHTDKRQFGLLCQWCLSWRKGFGSCAALIFVGVVVVADGGRMPADAEQKLAACGVETVFSTSFAFAAKCKNGTIVPWGDSRSTCHLP